MSMMICPRCWNVVKPCDKCENTGKVLDMQLSPNFKLSELLYSRTAVEKKIPNDPSPIQVARLTESCRSLFQRVRDGIGPMKVTSGFRSAQLNQAIKGSQTSAHMAGFGLDSQPQNVSLEDSMRWLYQHRSELKFDQAILELGNHHGQVSDDWLHLGWKHPVNYTQRQEFLIMENGKYRPWKP